MDPKKPQGAGLPREELQGKLKDPTGTDPASTGDPVDEQRQPKGGEGKEGGAAGKFDDARKTER